MRNNLYLIAIFNSKKAKSYFITEVVEAETPNEAESQVIGKKYYYDFSEKRILGVCRKAELINII